MGNRICTHGAERFCRTASTAPPEPHRSHRGQFSWPQPAVLEPGNERFEYFLRILYGLAADGLTDKKSRPKSIKHAAILLHMADAKMNGLLGLVSPLLKGVAKKAQANGDEQKLIDKYCV
jgi:hypothetical protein